MPSKIATPHRSPQTAIDEVQLEVEAQNSKPEPLYYELGVTHVSLKDEVDVVDS
ncbi:hypothetical protein BD410DRAFT_794765 [Rickenella mellea]|uniref:Uncharacterized protein n=1 Tax=Rickenella mellea TaxID=50990 RepID=A0A4Y7PQ33_9AGAM|nr:hypothetical protein BD410DRAFT_794765 [Rickenella mellea]